MYPAHEAEGTRQRGDCGPALLEQEVIGRRGEASGRLLTLWGG